MTAVFTQSPVNAAITLTARSCDLGTGIAIASDTDRRAALTIVSVSPQRPARARPFRRTRPTRRFESSNSPKPKHNAARAAGHANQHPRMKQEDQL
jgi:hypothetical protein